MNRLILIGNGFDLCHNMETGYQSFILSILKKGMAESYPKQVYKHSLFEIAGGGRIAGSPSPDDFLKKLTNIQDVFESSHINHNLNGETKVNPTNLFNIKINSDFFRHIIKNFSINRWVDVESEYYSFLQSISIDSNSDNKEQTIKTLNEDLKIISDELAQYIRDQQLKFDFQKLEKQNPDFIDKISGLLFSRIIYSSGTVGAQYGAMILNYNYTETVRNYIGKSKFDYSAEILNIHGSLNNDKGIIFGYGHVEGDTYSALEKLRIDEALKSLKMFNYHLSSEYGKLTQFLQKDEYDVFILGHSCGESDGTTLRRIFDNKNCKRINVCHIGIEEYQSKTMDIKRHCLSEEVHDKIQAYNVELIFPKLPKNE